jgi:hypothetical protein
VAVLSPRMIMAVMHAMLGGLGEVAQGGGVLLSKRASEALRTTRSMLELFCSRCPTFMTMIRWGSTSKVDSVNSSNEILQCACILWPART